MRIIYKGFNYDLESRLKINQSLSFSQCKVAKYFGKYHNHLKSDLNKKMNSRRNM